MIFPKTYRVLNTNTFSKGEYSIVPIRYEDRFKIMEWRNEQIYHLRQREPLTKEDQDAGQFFWEKLDAESNEIIFGKDSIPIVLPRNLVQDIDTLEDWKMAEALYEIMMRK